MKFWSISYPDLNNGLGCRATLWTSGCKHHCPYCQNKKTWNFNSGRDFTDEIKKELFDVLSLPYIKGLTLSGGDPVDNADDILKLLKEVKEVFPTKDVWLYTGYTLEEMENDDKKKTLLPYIDVLVDGEFQIDKRDITLKFRGSSNQVIWEKDKEGNFVRSKLNE